MKLGEYLIEQNKISKSAANINTDNLSGDFTHHMDNLSQNSFAYK